VIIKSLSRKSNTGQLVSYVFKYVFKEQDAKHTRREQSKNEKSKFIIRHNIRSRSVKGFIKEFKENEKYRLVHRKDSVKLFHTIISFSNKDKEHINDKLLKDIGKKFIEERGLNNMYAGTKHENKDHIHLHITVSGTQLNGRSSRISKQQLQHIKIVLDKYQREKYPQLKHSLPEHGKSRRLTKEAIVERVKTERQTDKQALIECLEKAYTGSRSQEQFLSQLKQAGHQPYFRNGAFQGVKFEGQMKYRLTNLGFDKTRLAVLDQVKATQGKALAELQDIRSGRNKDLKRAIPEPDLKKTTTEVLDKNEQKAMDELSEIRSSHENKEIERDEPDQDYNRDLVTDESNNNEDETKERDDETSDDEFATESEEAV
jgi:hypothetical protein